VKAASGQSQTILITTKGYLFREIQSGTGTVTTLLLRDHGNAMNGTQQGSVYAIAER